MSMDKEAIRKALDEATPGPWSGEGREIWHRGTSYHSETDPHKWVCDVIGDEDREMIVNAPTWLRYLLDENEHLLALKNEISDNALREIESLRAELKLSRENGANIEHNRKLNQEEKLQALRERDEAWQERDFYKEDRDRCERLERGAFESLQKVEQANAALLECVRHYADRRNHPPFWVYEVGQKARETLDKYDTARLTVQGEDAHG